MDPLRGTAALLRLARRAGVRLLPNHPVRAIRREGAGFLAEAGGRRLRAGRVVNAAGPWSGQVAAMAGAPLPIGAAVQQVVVTEAAPGPILPHLVLHAGRHLSLKQGDGGHLILGGAWPGEAARGGTRNLRASIEGNLWTAAHVLPALAGLHLLRAWTGMNVQVPGPILGEDPRVPGLFHAVTYNGWTLGPVAGQLIAEAVRGGRGPHPAFSPGRLLPVHAGAG
jgi:glycine/D-amino acid oxidase-like deaminating enzyme